MDRILGERAKWQAFKLVTRDTLDAVRAELTRQAALGIEKPTDWSTLEVGTSSAAAATATATGASTETPAPKPSKRRVPLALVNRAHTHVLTTCSKLRKGLADELIDKKMTSEESAVMDFHVWQAIEAQPRLQALLVALVKEAGHEQPMIASKERTKMDDYLRTLDAPRIMADHALVRKLAQAYRTRRASADPPPVLFLWDVYLEYVVRDVVMPPVCAKLVPLGHAFNLIARHVAHKCTDIRTSERDRETPELKWLRYPLGMSAESYDSVRKWFFRYAMFDQPDDRYKRWTRHVGEQSLYDFLVLKVYFRLVTYYRNAGPGVFFLSEGIFDKQQQALMSRLELMEYTAAPESLGTALYCVQCDRWATPPQPTPVWVTCRYDAKLMALESARLAKLNQDQRLELADHIRKLVPIGESSGVLSANPENGGLFCKHSQPAKKNKALSVAMTAVRRVEAKDSATAHAPHGAHAAPTATTRAVEDREDDEDEEDEDEDLLAHLSQADEEEEDEDDEEEDEEDEDSDEEGEGEGKATRPAKRTRTKPASSSAHATNGPDNGPPSPLTMTAGERKAENRRIRMRTTAYLRSLIMAPISAARPRFNQGHTEPLWRIIMPGVMINMGRGEWMALCCTCGNLMQVTQGKWTNAGLSCMNHPHAGEFPMDHPHTLAWRYLDHALKIRRDAPNEYTPIWPSRLRDEPVWPPPDYPRRHPLLLVEGIKCSVEGCVKHTRRVVHAMNHLLRWREVALCEDHLALLRLAVPTIRSHGNSEGPIMETFPLEWLEHELAMRQESTGTHTAPRPQTPGPAVDPLADISRDTLDALWLKRPDLRIPYETRHLVQGTDAIKALNRTIRGAVKDLDKQGV